MGVPEHRIRLCNTAPVREDRDFVVYWMIAYRRPAWNFALDRAIEWAESLHKPLVILEALRLDYRWASDRLHGFVLEGMADNARLLETSRVAYYPHVELRPGEGKGLLGAMAEHSCVAVTDDFPGFFLPRMVGTATRRLSVRLEAVDSNGILPMRAADRAFPSAYAFRRFLQKNLPQHLMNFPKRNPLENATFPAAPKIPKNIADRWPRLTVRRLAQSNDLVAGLNVNHNVAAGPLRGGTQQARARLKEFLRSRLDNYEAGRNAPEQSAASGLSPYLHFGQISAHEIFAELAKREKWTPERLSLRANGSRIGWWGASLPAEAFLDQLITWRELGLNFCCHRGDADQYNSLPEWAKNTLEKHARDERRYRYTLEQFEAAATHDPLWNAAQTQLVREGVMHNYLRMLWGKKILEWTKSPAIALEIMIELNNKYALDGRDPNSYSGIFWCLGRYDRPWGPERPIFGTVRYMSSENTARKFPVKNYIRKYS